MSDTPEFTAQDFRDAFQTIHGLEGMEGNLGGYQFRMALAICAGMQIGIMEREGVLDWKTALDMDPECAAMPLQRREGWLEKVNTVVNVIGNVLDQLRPTDIDTPKVEQTSVRGVYLWNEWTGSETIGPVGKDQLRLALTTFVGRQLSKERDIELGREKPRTVEPIESPLVIGWDVIEDLCPNIKSLTPEQREAWLLKVNDVATYLSVLDLITSNTDDAIEDTKAVNLPDILEQAGINEGDVPDKNLDAIQIAQALNFIKGKYAQGFVLDKLGAKDFGIPVHSTENITPYTKGIIDFVGLLKKMADYTFDKWHKDETQAYRRDRVKLVETDSSGDNYPEGTANIDLGYEFNPNEVKVAVGLILHDFSWDEIVRFYPDLVKVSEAERGKSILRINTLKFMMEEAIGEAVQQRIDNERSAKVAL